MADVHEKLDPTYVAEQCANWDVVVRRMYKACMDKAIVNDMLASLTSMIVIVLNVLVVGKQDLNLPNVAVSIIVVFNSVIKALQMQFKYAPHAAQLHSAKASLRDCCVKIDDAMTMGKYGMYTQTQLESLRVDVQQSINAAPGFINIDPPEGTSFKGLRVPSMPKFKDLFSKSAEKAQAAQGLNQPDPSVVGPVDVEAPRSDRRVLPEAQHAMTPADVVPAPPLAAPDLPPDPEQAGGEQAAPLLASGNVAADAAGRSGLDSAFALVPGSVPAALPKGADGSASAIAAGGADAALAAAGSLIDPSCIYEVQRKTLDGLSQILLAAVQLSSFSLRFYKSAATMMSAVELLLNALIMICSSIEALDSASKEVVAVSAAVNAVLKGLDMKLQFDVHAADCQTAFGKFKALQEKVNAAKMEVDCSNTAMNPAAFSDLKSDFQSLVNTYAHWIPTQIK